MSQLRFVKIWLKGVKMEFKKGVRCDFLTSDPSLDSKNIKILLIKQGVRQSDMAKIIRSVNKCVN